MGKDESRRRTPRLASTAARGWAWTCGRSAGGSRETAAAVGAGVLGRAGRLGTLSDGKLKASTKTAISGSATPMAKTKFNHQGRNEKDRIKYGTASWVYGERTGPDQRDVVSPDTKRWPTTVSMKAKCPDYFLNRWAQCAPG